MAKVTVTGPVPVMVCTSGQCTHSTAAADWSKVALVDITLVKGLSSTAYAMFIPSMAAAAARHCRRLSFLPIVAGRLTHTGPCLTEEQVGCIRKGDARQEVRDLMMTLPEGCQWK